MKKLVLLLAFAGGSRYAMAQQDLGVRNSNYAGIQGALLNPSSIAGSKLDWDVNILSINELFANNFLYTPKSNLKFLGIGHIVQGSIKETIWGTRFDVNNPNKLYSVVSSTEVLGPSFYMKVRKKHYIGLTIEGRAYGNVRNITGGLAQNAYAYFDQTDLFNTTLTDNTANVNAMAWLQYGIHYATVLYQKGRDQLKGGLSLNYLQGIAAAYATNTHVTYAVNDTANINFSNSSLDYGRTNFDDFRKIRGYSSLNHGHGFGADIGFTYVKAAKEADGYVYRIGLSLLDIGSINFNRNTATYHLATVNGNFENWHQAKFSGNDQVDQTLSAVFYGGDSSASYTSSRFRMAMPAALSLQADYHVAKDFYANATIVQGFHHGDRPGVVRPDVYSITPRYETKWLEVSLPLSLLYYNYWQPRIGLAVRVGYFFFGGDAPGALLKLNDLQSADVYAGLRFFLTKK